MGVIGRNKKIWTEDDIQNKLSAFFMSESNVKYRCENLFLFKKWESDLILITKSNLIYEFEIKISKADFKNDFKNKKQKHTILTENKEDNQKPNYFYYAVPENLIDENDIPDYAGLIYMVQYYPYFKIVKSAPKIHNIKYSDNDLNLVEKFYYNYRQNKIKLKSKNNDINDIKSLLDEAVNKPENEKISYSDLLKKYNENNKLIELYEQKKTELIKKITILEEDIIFNESVTRQLHNILKDNNVEYDYNEIEKKALERVKDKKNIILW